VVVDGFVISCVTGMNSADAVALRTVPGRSTTTTLGSNPTPGMMFVRVLFLCRTLEVETLDRPIPPSNAMFLKIWRRGRLHRR
jgi:hypothetical protein